MKIEHDDLNPLSQTAQRAFENYPQIAASPQAGSTPSAPTIAMNERAPDALLADSLSPRNRLAWAREGFAPPSGWEYSAPSTNEMQSPARREKSVSEMEDRRSSTCPAAFRSLV